MRASLDSRPPIRTRERLEIALNRYEAFFSSRSDFILNAISVLSKETIPRLVLEHRKTK